MPIYISSCLCVLLTLCTSGGLCKHASFMTLSCLQHASFMPLSACSIDQKPICKPDIQVPEIATPEPQSGSDYLLQRFLGSESIQAMRKALSTFGANKERDETDSQLLQGDQRHQPSLTVRLRASLFGTDLGANLTVGSCLLSFLLLTPRVDLLPMPDAAVRVRHYLSSAHIL